MAGPLKILSIDGGGIRGLIPALVLTEVERRTGRPVAELFDLIAGTSTGGILACGLTKPGDDGRPQYSAARMVDLYDKEGPAIFSRSVRHRIVSAGGLADEKYPNDGIDGALASYFEDARLKDALTDILVTAYDTDARLPFFFRSARARERKDYDFPLRVVARATSSAPTYFEALAVEDAAARAYSLVDGGVFATNPGMCALAEVRRDHPSTEVLVLSLGTGELTRRLPHRKVKDWGLVEWARPIIDIVFDGVSDTVDYQLEQLLGGAYFRLQTELDRANDDMDDATEDNLRLLRQEAEELIEDEAPKLDEVCRRLAA